MELELVLSLGLVVVFYALYYVLFVGKAPDVRHCSCEGSVAARLARDLPILREKFWPTFGLDNKHCQTLLGNHTHGLLFVQNKKMNIGDLFAVSRSAFF